MIIQGSLALSEGELDGYYKMGLLSLLVPSQITTSTITEMIADALIVLYQKFYGRKRNISTWKREVGHQ